MKELNDIEIMHCIQALKMYSTTFLFKTNKDDVLYLINKLEDESKKRKVGTTGKETK